MSTSLHDFLVFVNPTLCDEDSSVGIRHFIEFFEVYCHFY